MARSFGHANCVGQNKATADQVARLHAAARQIRDVWQEKVSAGEYLFPKPAGKYELCKQIEAPQPKPADLLLNTS